MIKGYKVDSKNYPELDLYVTFNEDLPAILNDKDYADHDFLLVIGKDNVGRVIFFNDILNLQEIDIRQVPSYFASRN